MNDVCEYTRISACNDQGYVPDGSGTCVCDEPDDDLMDVTCAYTDAITCNGHGSVASATNSTCTCDEGYSGDRCLLDTFYGCDLQTAGKECELPCKLAHGYWTLNTEPGTLFSFGDTPIVVVDENENTTIWYDSIQTNDDDTPRISLGFQDGATKQSVTVKVKLDGIIAPEAMYDYKNRDQCFNFFDFNDDPFILSWSPGSPTFTRITVYPCDADADGSTCEPFLADVYLSWEPPQLESDVITLISYTLTRTHTSNASDYNKSFTFEPHVTSFVDRPHPGTNTYTLNFVAQRSSSTLYGHSVSSTLDVPVGSSVCDTTWDAVTGLCTTLPFTVVMNDLQIFFTTDEDGEKVRHPVPNNDHGIVTFTTPLRIVYPDSPADSPAAKLVADSDQRDPDNNPIVQMAWTPAAGGDDGSVYVELIASRHTGGSPFLDFTTDYTNVVVTPRPHPAYESESSHTLQMTYTTDNVNEVEVNQLFGDEQQFGEFTVRNPRRVLPPLYVSPPVIRSYDNDYTAPRNTVMVEMKVDPPPVGAQDTTLFMNESESGVGEFQGDGDGNDIIIVLDVDPNTTYTYNFYYTMPDGYASDIVSHTIAVGDTSSYCDNPAQWSDLTQQCYPILGVTVPSFEMARMVDGKAHSVIQALPSIITFHPVPVVGTESKPSDATWDTNAIRTWFTSIQMHKRYSTTLNARGEPVLLWEKPALQLGFRYLPNGRMEMVVVTTIYTNDIISTSGFILQPALNTGDFTTAFTFDAQFTEFFDLTTALDLASDKSLQTEGFTFDANRAVDGGGTFEVYLRLRPVDTPPAEPRPQFLTHTVDVCVGNAVDGECVSNTVDVTLTWTGSAYTAYALERHNNDGTVTSLLSNTVTFTYKDSVLASSNYTYTLTVADPSDDVPVETRMVVVGDYANLCTDAGFYPVDNMCFEAGNTDVIDPVITYPCKGSACANEVDVLLQWDTKLNPNEAAYTVKYKSATATDAQWTTLVEEEQMTSSLVTYHHRGVIAPGNYQYAFSAKSESTAVPESLTNVDVQAYSSTVCALFPADNAWGHELYNEREGGFCYVPSNAENNAYCMATGADVHYGTLSSSCSPLVCSDPVELADGTAVSDLHDVDKNRIDHFKKCYCSGKGSWDETGSKCYCPNEEGFPGYWDGITCNYSEHCKENTDDGEIECVWPVGFGPQTGITACVQNICAGTRRVDLEIVFPFNTGTYFIRRKFRGEEWSEEAEFSLGGNATAQFAEDVDVGNDVEYEVRAIDDGGVRETEWTGITFANPVYSMGECDLLNPGEYVLSNTGDYCVESRLTELNELFSEDWVVKYASGAITGASFTKPPTVEYIDNEDAQVRGAWLMFTTSDENGDSIKVGVRHTAADEEEVQFYFKDEMFTLEGPLVVSDFTNVNLVGVVELMKRGQIVAATSLDDFSGFCVR